MSETKVEKISMVIEGQAITTFARRMFYEGQITDIGKHYPPNKRKQRAFQILNGLRPRLTEIQKLKVLKGDAYLKGDSSKGIGYVPKKDFEFKYQRQGKEMGELIKYLADVLEAVMAKNKLYTDKLETRLYGKPIAEKIKENKEMDKQAKRFTTSRVKGKVNLSGVQVDKKVLEEYVKAIDWHEKAQTMGMALMKPDVSHKAFQLRIQKHMAIFESVGMEYYGGAKGEKEFKGTKEQLEKSKQMYEDIQKYIDKNHPDMTLQKRLERSKNNAKMMSGNLGDSYR